MAIKDSMVLGTKVVMIASVYSLNSNLITFSLPKFLQEFLMEMLFHFLLLISEMKVANGGISFNFVLLYIIITYFSDAI